MNKEIIFIGGIHGVGKTTLCDKLSTEMDIKHYSASCLIMTIKKYHGNCQDKRVLDIKDNQELLMYAIDRYIEKASFCFLDGHFCLLNSENKVCKISKETFKNIDPIGIIVLHDSVTYVLKKITKRDETDYNISLLSSFQDSEIEYANDIARELQIPRMLFNVNNNISEVVKFITDITGRKNQ